MDLFNDNYWEMHFVGGYLDPLHNLNFLFSLWPKKSSYKHLPFDRRTPLDILKERYTHGDITQEAYLEAKETIDSKK